MPLEHLTLNHQQTDLQEKCPNLVGNKRTRDTSEKCLDINHVTLHSKDFHFESLFDVPLFEGIPINQISSKSSNTVGCVLNGYCADITCCVPKERPSEFSDLLLTTITLGHLHTYYTSLVHSLLTLELKRVSDMTVPSAFCQPVAATLSTERPTYTVNSIKHSNDCAVSLTPWEGHYRRNLNHFPLKNYIAKAFPCLLSNMIRIKSVDTSYCLASSDPCSDIVPTRISGGRRLIMECGCGNGSAIMSLMRLFPEDCFICFDISPTAVDILENHPITQEFIKNRKQREVDYLSSQSSRCSPTTPELAHLLTWEAIPPFIGFPFDITVRDIVFDEEFIERHIIQKIAANIDIESPQRLLSETSQSSTLVHHHEKRLKKGSVDILLLIFVLCALPSVGDMMYALQRLYYWVKPGEWRRPSREPCHEGRLHEEDDGLGYSRCAQEWIGGRLLFRDYAILDHNMGRYIMKSSTSSPQTGDEEIKVDECQITSYLSHRCPSPFFLKGDGTSQFFFEKTFVVALFKAAGFVPISVEYHCNKVVNRKNNKSMCKVFINAEFGRPS